MPNPPPNPAAGVVLKPVAGAAPNPVAADVAGAPNPVVGAPKPPAVDVAGAPNPVVGAPKPPAVDVAGAPNPVVGAPKPPGADVAGAPNADVVFNPRLGAAVLALADPKPPKLLVVGVAGGAPNGEDVAGLLNPPNPEFTN